MNINLSIVKCLPLLVNGKVAVVNQDNSISFYRPSKYTTIADNYNPMDYAILISAKWAKCIVYATAEDKDYASALNQIHNLQKHAPFRKGDKIHLHSRQGIYEVVDITVDATNITATVITITCKKWQHTDTPTHTVLITDFKCLAGGLKNYAE